MEISPRPFSDILNDGMRMLGRVWRRLFAPTFWSFILVGALTLAVFAMTGADEVIRLVLTDPSALARLGEAEQLEVSVRLFQGVSISALLQLVATGFVNLTAHRVVGSELGGERLSTGAAVSSALARLAPLILAGVIVLVGVLAGLVLLIIPGIWLAGYATMISPVIAIEGAGPLQALRRSFALVRGRWWATVGFLVLVGLLGSVAAQLVQLLAIPVLATGGAGIGVGLAFVVLVVAQGLVVAAIAVMTTLWYVDLRARKEQLLSSSLL